MYSGIIKTPFHDYKITGIGYEAAYYIIGGQWRVPVYEVKDGKATGVNSSAGFTTEKQAVDFYFTGKPASAIY